MLRVSNCKTYNANLDMHYKRICHYCHCSEDIGKVIRVRSLCLCKSAWKKAHLASLEAKGSNSVCKSLIVKPVCLSTDELERSQNQTKSNICMPHTIKVNVTLPHRSAQLLLHIAKAAHRIPDCGRFTDYSQHGIFVAIEIGVVCKLLKARQTQPRCSKRPGVLFSTVTIHRSSRQTLYPIFPVCVVVKCDLV